MSISYSKEAKPVPIKFESFLRFNAGLQRDSDNRYSDEYVVINELSITFPLVSRLKP